MDLDGIDIELSSENMAERREEERNEKKEKCKNFLKQFRDDKNLTSFKQFNAQQFMDVWSHYDTDNNGYIEGGELDGFLKEFVTSTIPGDVKSEALTEETLAVLRDAFLDAYDENDDNRIDISEMAEVLPLEESFLLCFRKQIPMDSSIDFMKVWKQFDTDNSGYIEADELRNFLKHLLREASKETEVSEEQLVQYTDTMLQLFDRNRDGKLQLSEMAKLLPVKENFLCKPMFKTAIDAKITKRDIDRVFDLYDTDKNGKIENEELSGFLKDLIELACEDYDTEDLDSCKRAILKVCDLNQDGKIDKDELTMILLQYSAMSQQNE